MQFHHKPPFSRGYTPLVSRSGATADMLMEFGVIVLLPGETWEWRSETDEQCLLLARGSARIDWMVYAAGTGPLDAEVSRPDLFDYSPWCLSVPRRSTVVIHAGPEGAEWLYTATDNPASFKAKLYTPEECKSEFRGAGTMRETSTRIVRTVFDDTNRPESNLVIGEVIGVPGKWSSYPPHHHPQPEIYHYRFLPDQGFGLTAIGINPYIIRNRDTILIRDGEDHPQVTAPGYAMWYLWVIRHLEGNRYGIQTVAEEHAWVAGSEKNIWQPKR
jgi:5-deoxy-glucuronate isomerase